MPKHLGSLAPLHHWLGRHPRAAGPLAASFGAAVRCKNLLYDRGWCPVRWMDVPTLSVGGLEVGGSGKTPVAAHLLRLLLNMGARPGLASRGYRRQGRGLHVRVPGSLAEPDAIGDEPAMLVQGGLNIHVAACAERAEGAQALQGLGCTAVVLDDGFSHRRLGRHLDVVVLRGEAPFGPGGMLPLGSLREPPEQLGRAHVVWLHYKSTARDAIDPHTMPPWFNALCPQALRVVSVAAPSGPRALGPASAEAISGLPSGTAVLGVCGIANPNTFIGSLHAANMQVKDALFFADHHRYTTADVHTIQCRKMQQAAEAVVVTAKDAVKLAPLWPSADVLWVLDYDVEVLVNQEPLGLTLKTLLNQ